MQKEKSKKIILAVVGVLILAGAFYGGIVYGKSQIPVRGQGVAGFARVNGRTGGSFGGLTTGQIIGKDATSITVSVQGGGSKIIFLDNNTKVSKQTAGTAADLVLGTEVSVTGTANTDGSVNAQSVQIRPNVPVTARSPSVVK